VSQSLPPQAGRRAVVGLFEDEAQAQAAVEALRSNDISEQHVGMLSPSVGAGDVQAQLVSMDVPDGESRYYAEQVRAGHTLLIVDADGDYQHTRELLQRYGAADVQSRGAELTQADDAGTPVGTGPRPIDVTGRWEDVISRYEMLFQQHYGTSDTTWQQMAPVYRWAWGAANDPRYRGQPFSKVEANLKESWSGPQQWDLVKGPIQDVWTDVADEAATGAEGGQDRRILRQGSDQLVPARDVVPPPEPIK
jgi:hypothetical protein